MKNLIIILSVFAALQFNLIAKNTFYVLNYSWHTGYLIAVNQQTIELIPALKHFEKYQYVDIGWGDDEFYRSPKNFDALLALKAMTYPTSSTVRIEGTNYPLKYQIDRFNFLIEYDFDDRQFQDLAEFINSSILYENGKATVIEKRLNGKIIFFNSTLKYHLFNTCNTWIARGLELSGCDSKSRGIVLAAYLYHRFAACGKVIKSLQD